MRKRKKRKSKLKMATNVGFSMVHSTNISKYNLICCYICVIVNLCLMCASYYRVSFNTVNIHMETILSIYIYIMILQCDGKRKALTNSILQSFIFLLFFFHFYLSLHAVVYFCSFILLFFHFPFIFS